MVLGGVALAAALGGTPSLAGVSERSWEVGGYALFTRYSNSSTVEDSLFGPGVRGAYHFKENAGVEIDLEFSTSDHVDRSVDIEFDVMKLGVNYIRSFKSKKGEKVSPLLIFGLGRISIDDGDEESTATFLRAGGGVRIFFTPNLALRIDGRMFHWRGDNQAVPREGFFSFDTTLGLSYTFGGGS